MISKCANPDGSNPFRYLQGRKAGRLRQANQIPGSGTIDSSLPGCVGAVRQRSRSGSRKGRGVIMPQIVGVDDFSQSPWKLSDVT